MIPIHWRLNTIHSLKQTEWVAFVLLCTQKCTQKDITEDKACWLTGSRCLSASNYYVQKLTNKVGPDVAGLRVDAEDRAKALGKGVQLRPMSVQQVVVIAQPCWQVLVMHGNPDSSRNFLGLVKCLARHRQQLLRCHVMIEVLQRCCHRVKCGVQSILRTQYTSIHSGPAVTCPTADSYFLFSTITKQ